MKNIFLYQSYEGFDYEEAVDFNLEQLSDKCYYIFTDDYALSTSKNLLKDYDKEVTEQLEAIQDRLDNGDELAKDIMEDYEDFTFVYLRKNSKSNVYYIDDRIDCKFDSGRIGIVVFSKYNRTIKNGEIIYTLKTKEELEEDEREIEETLDCINNINHSEYFNGIEVTEDNVLNIIRDLEDYSYVDFDSMYNDDELSQYQKDCEAINMDRHSYGHIADMVREHFGIEETEEDTND